MQLGHVRRRWLIAVAVLGALTSSCQGTIADFHASPIWVTVSWWITIGTGGSLAIWVNFVLIPREPSVGIFKECVAALAILCAGMWLCGTALTRSLPDIYTRIAGDPFTLVQPGRKGYCRIGKCRTCKVRVYAPLFETGSLDSWYCAGDAEFYALPDKGEYAIHGRKTWFGRHIDRVLPATSQP